MLSAPSASRLNSAFLDCTFKQSSSVSLTRKQRKSRRAPASYPCVRAIDLDQNTFSRSDVKIPTVAIAVGVVSVAVGIGVPIFYETQIDTAAKRDNTQPCFPCNGSGALGMSLLSLVEMRKKSPGASIVMAHAREMAFNHDTLIAENSRMMTK